MMDFEHSHANAYMIHYREMFISGEKSFLTPAVVENGAF